MTVFVAHYAINHPRGGEKMSKFVLAKKERGISAVFLAFSFVTVCAQAADWEPVLDIRLVSDDNVTSTTIDQIESVVVVVKPSLAVTTESEGLKFRGYYGIDSGEYLDSKQDNYTDHTFMLNAELAFAARHRLNLSGDYNLLHDERGQGISQGGGSLLLVPDEYSQVAADAAYSYGAESARGGLDFSIGLGAIDYDSRFVDDGAGGLRDRTATRSYQFQSLGSAYSWSVSPDTKVLVELTAKNITYDVPRVTGTLDSLEADFFAGISWDVTGKSSGVFKLGYRTKDFEAENREDFSGPSWELRLSYTPRAYSTFEIASERKSRETDGLGSFIDSTLYSLSWDHDWSQRVSSSIKYRLENFNYVSTLRDDDRDYFTLSMDYAWRHWCAFQIGASNNSTESTIRLYDYDRQKVFLGVVITL